MWVIKVSLLFSTPFHPLNKGRLYNIFLNIYAFYLQKFMVAEPLSNPSAEILQ